MIIQLHLTLTPGFKKARALCVLTGNDVLILFALRSSPGQKENVECHKNIIHLKYLVSERKLRVFSKIKEGENYNHPA